MATVIYDTAEVEVDAPNGSRWLMQPDAFAELTGWNLKPEGLCRGDVCAPIFQPADVLSDGMIDLAGAAPLIGMAAVVDPGRAVAALVPSASARGEEMTSLQAPDFTLDDLSGQPVSLHDFDRRKVLLLAWSSW